MDKISRENYIQFDKGLKNVIDSFEKAREWADLSACLQKLKKQIDQNKNLPIPRQRDLAKRLAQCLNPEINVIHQLTLEVYRDVFEREVELMEKEMQFIELYDRKSSIALFFSGLFNFYQFAAFEVKQSFLELIKVYLLKMKKELILSLPGFILCMLPALEDQNGEILKRVESILQETEKIVGTSEFYGEIWKAMLRTPRARLSAIKYLDKKIPQTIKHAREIRDKKGIYISDYTIKIVNREVSLQKDLKKKTLEEQMRQKMELHDYFYFYYPNKSKLIMNALIAGLSITQDQVPVNRGTLDFLISHMPINSPINSIEENIKLVECATLAYTKKDFATLNKISNWLFSHIDEDEEEIDFRDPTIITIVESQKNLFRQSMDLQQNAMIGSNKVNDQVGVNQFNNIDKLIVNTINVLLRILSDEQNTTVPILKNLSIPLIKFIKFHLLNRNADLQKFKQNIENLIDQIAPYYKAVLESLDTKLLQEIENLDYNVDHVENMHIESIDLISFAITVMNDLSKNKLMRSENSQLYLIQIMSNLLRGMNKLSNDNQNMDIIAPSLDVIEQILDILYSYQNGKMLHQQRSHQKFRESIESFNNLYIMMSRKLLKDFSDNQENNQTQKLELDCFNKYNYIMVKIFQFQNVDQTTSQMPQWLDMLIQSSKIKRTQICTISIERFLDLLKMTDQTNQAGGGAISNIQRLIAGDHGRPKSMFTTDKRRENQDTFKKEFFQILQESSDHREEEMEGFKNGHIHCKEIIRNLWYLLGKEIDTENSVRQLKEFEQYVPRIVSDVIIEDLQDKNDRAKQDDAIKKFAIFWKHTAQEYPSYKPFESDNIKGKKYLVLHNMINFLEDPDPTLRLSCRSWLSQNKQFNRIIDPIIEEFIRYSNFKITQNNNVVIVGDFETTYVIENFGKLRNIILSQDDIFEYILARSILLQYYKLYIEKYQNVQNFQKLYDQQSQQYQDNNYGQINSHLYTGEINVPKESITELYIYVLVQITLHFIRAEYPQDQSNVYNNKSQNQNQIATTLTVNASACEFMELILKQAEKYHSYCNKITHIIIGPLIDTFYHIIEKKNYAMQVNIINLLISILNDCNFQGDKIDSNSDRKQLEISTERCINIFKNSKLIESIILGLKCDVSFVRQRFIKFVEMYIPYLRNFTKIHESFQDIFKLHVEKLLDCFCQLLKRVDITQFSTSLKKKNQSVTMIRRDNQRDKSGGRPSIGFNKQQTQQNIGSNIGETRLLIPESGSVGDQAETMLINQESDILMIIVGLQKIINTCLDIKQEGQQIVDEPNEDELNDEEQIRLGRLSRSDQKKNQGFFTKMFGGGETSYFAPDVFQEVRKSIHDRMSDILVSCVHCWNHVEHFNQIDYHFTRFGQFPYYGEYTKIIIDQIKTKKEKDKDPYSKNLQQQISDKIEDQFKKQTLEDYMTLNLNSIQKTVLKLLRPIAKKIPDQLIEGVLNVWLRKSLLGKIDINRGYEKIIQILICIMQASQNQKQQNKIDFILPIHQVIQSLIKFIQTRKPQESLVNVQRWVKGNNPPLLTTHTSSETLLNSFLYAYLCYNPSMFDPVYESHSEEKQKEFQKVYAILIKYFNVFKTSRNPFTINWLLEILNLVCLKFQMTETKLDSRLKKEYHDLFNSILINCTQIITDTFKISFHEDQNYLIALPPSIYEILWRYEYISFKNQINESGDYISFNENNHTSKISNINRQVDKFKKSQTFSDQNNQLQKKNTLKSSQQISVQPQNGSIFFNKSILKLLVEQRFEYQYSGTNANNDVSVSKSLEVLYRERGQLPIEYINQSNFMEIIKVSLRGHTTPDHLLYQSQFYIIMTLKWVFCQLLVNLVGISDSEKTNASLQILMQTIIQILQEKDKKEKEKQQPQSYNQMDLTMNEFIIDFFSSIVQQCHQLDSNLIKPYKKDIIELFNQDSFFQCSMINLKQWQKIIKCFNEGKPDEMFEEQMQKWNFQGGLFASNNTVIVQRCYAMKRIAFLIFSCGDDDFYNQLDQLMKKMIEVFKQRQREKSDIKQRIFVFFLTRVILIRLNFQTLTEALRKLWPHLLNELISVFEIKQELQQQVTNAQNNMLDKENTDLTIEAIKLVELLSSLNMEDFQMNQWIFLIDGYGMHKEFLDNQRQINQSDVSEPSSINSQSTYQKLQDAKKQSINAGIVKTPRLGSGEQQQFQFEQNSDIFKTFIVRFIGNQEYSFYNVETPQDGNDKSIIESYYNNDVQEARDLELNAKIQNTIQRSQNKNLKSPNSIDDNTIDPQSVRDIKNMNSMQGNYEQNNQFTITRSGEFDNRLQEQACKLQQSINDSNVTGNEFNRQEAEAKIEVDFLKNDDILRL